MPEEPHLDEKTINYMLELYSNATPTVNDSERQIWIRVGKRAAAHEMRDRLAIQKYNNRSKNK